MAMANLKNEGEDKSYQDLLEELLVEESQQEDIIGILLTGSVARGDALPGSDLDVRLLLSAGKNRAFHSEIRYGIMVERSYADVPLAQSRLTTNPMEVYAYLDGRILRDSTGTLHQLQQMAEEIFESYQFPQQEVQGLSYWLKSARLKMSVALRAGDLLKGAFVCSTTSWQILMGLWMVNNKPMPPNGSVLVHLKDLSNRPPDLNKELDAIFCGDTQERIQTAIGLIDWILESLEGDSSLSLHSGLKAHSPLRMTGAGERRGCGEEQGDSSLDAQNDMA